MICAVSHANQSFIIYGCPSWWLQHVNTYRLPARLVHSECSYRLTNRVLTDYIKATGALQPLLVEFFQSFDMSEYEEDSFTPVPIGEDEGTSGVIALVEE